MEEEYERALEQRRLQLEAERAAAAAVTQDSGHHCSQQQHVAQDIGTLAAGDTIASSTVAQSTCNTDPSTVSEAENMVQAVLVSQAVQQMQEQQDNAQAGVHAQPADDTLPSPTSYSVDMYGLLQQAAHNNQPSHASSSTASHISKALQPSPLLLPPLTQSPFALPAQQVLTPTTPVSALTQVLSAVTGDSAFMQQEATAAASTLGCSSDDPVVLPAGAAPGRGVFRSASDNNINQTGVNVPRDAGTKPSASPPAITFQYSPDFASYFGSQQADQTPSPTAAGSLASSSAKQGQQLQQHIHGQMSTGAVIAAPHGTPPRGPNVGAGILPPPASPSPVGSNTSGLGPSAAGVTGSIPAQPKPLYASPRARFSSPSLQTVLEGQDDVVDMGYNPGTGVHGSLAGQQAWSPSLTSPAAGGYGGVHSQPSPPWNTRTPTTPSAAGHNLLSTSPIQGSHYKTNFTSPSHWSGESVNQSNVLSQGLQSLALGANSQATAVSDMPRASSFTSQPLQHRAFSGAQVLQQLSQGLGTTQTQHLISWLSSELNGLHEREGSSSLSSFTESLRTAPSGASASSVSTSMVLPTSATALSGMVASTSADQLQEAAAGTSGAGVGGATDSMEHSPSGDSLEDLETMRLSSASFAAALAEAESIAANVAAAAQLAAASSGEPGSPGTR